MNEHFQIEWFPTKVDLWLGVILVVSPLAMLGFLLALDGLDAYWSGIALLVFILIYVTMVFPMRYGITENELVIRHGYFRQRIRLEAIISVKPTRSPMSSPALSLDRLEIKKGERFTDRVHISPRDKEAFLALLEMQGNLSREGNTLTRATATEPQAPQGN